MNFVQIIRDYTLFCLEAFWKRLLHKIGLLLSQEALAKKQPSKETHQLYHAYLVRCWLIPAVTAGESPAWRFELRQVPAEAEKNRFSDLEEVKEFMSEKLAAITPISNSEGDEEKNRL